MYLKKHGLKGKNNCYPVPIVSARNEMEVEVLARVAAGTRYAAALNRCFMAGWLSRSTKVEINTVIIRPAVLYGSETWRITNKMEHIQRGFENRILRRIYGPTYDGKKETWNRRLNFEIQKMAGAPLMSNVIRSQRSRWTGQVARRGDESLIRVATLLQPAGRLRVGRPRKRWQDSVHEDLRALGGYQNWVEAAQDREGWRDL